MMPVARLWSGWEPKRLEGRRSMLTRHNFRRAMGLATVALAAAWSHAALAQSYPARPITLIVPFAAGGPSDTLARLTAEHLGRTLAQTIIVENVGGAGGTTGTTRAAQAAPDGYTIFQHHSGLPASGALYANLKYDPATAFETVGLINTGPMVLTSRKTLDVKTGADLVAWMKAQGDKATMAHAGVGSNSFMCATLMIQTFGIKPAMVPYRGTGPAMKDVVGGQIDVLCDQATTATPQILSGTIKSYAVTSEERLPALKDVPSAPEAGLKGLEMTIWNGLYVPKGAPKEAIDKLHAALQKFIEDPKIVERFNATGTVPFPKERRTMAKHKEFLLAEVARYKDLIAKSGLKPANTK
jgi:tripartite-type tricarboxylate transporter receptor subunit TctC